MLSRPLVFYFIYFLFLDLIIIIYLFNTFFVFSPEPRKTGLAFYFPLTFFFLQDIIDKQKQSAHCPLVLA